MDPVHNECAVIHADLGCCDEVFNRGAACPGRVDKCIGMEKRTEIFPFAGIAGSDQ
jgi:hypothetical protein